MDLQTPIKKAGGIYQRYAGKLERLGIEKFEDFLFYFPFRYDDNSLISKINELQSGERVTIKGRVLQITNQYARRITIQRAKIQDETGTIDVIWFNQPFLTRIVSENDLVSLSGRVEQKGTKIAMQAPDYEVLLDSSDETLHTGRLVPVYSETKGISSRWIRAQVNKILKNGTQELTEYLPSSILKENAFMQVQSAIEQIHFPNTMESAQKARQRLSFDELFFLQLASLHRKNQWREKKTSQKFDIKKFQTALDIFVKKLPFELTTSQKNAKEDILSDLSQNTTMNRLLQGDVGSGKTVVAVIAMYAAFLNGYQSVFMAPTEILAEQHYATIANLLQPFGVKVNIATGSKKNAGDKTDVLVGTHAVLNEKIKLNKLGLVVIDEQQRFGVEQRATIRQKGDNPHLLTMTATPIPRTVALTMYGDLDVSYLHELPKGRKKITTWLVPPEKRTGAYEWIKKQILETKGQAFIICPFIEESETLTTVKAASKELEILKKNVFPDLRLGLLHGKLKAKEKNEILEQFKNKKFDILVATPVVEVGIDIPNATIIMIEAADRFGLSQLHQLRGRVGRGDKQSYCLLFTESKSPETNARLKAMETMQNGADLAEMDLKIRGSGDIYGTMQHGRKLLKVATFGDRELLEKARKEAERIYPDLQKYPKLLEKMQSQLTKNISPD